MRGDLRICAWYWLDEMGEQEERVKDGVQRGVEKRVSGDGRELGCWCVRYGERSCGAGPADEEDGGGPSGGSAARVDSGERWFGTWPGMVEERV